MKKFKEFINESTDWEEGWKMEHNVEDEWHYDILTKYGFEPINKTGIGFVRSYKYKNKDGHEISAHCGASSDYWRDESEDKSGYWASLEPHLKKITQQ